MNTKYYNNFTINSNVTNKMLIEIENIINSTRLGPEQKTGKVTALLRAHARSVPENTIIYRLVGDIVHDLTKEYISDFRTYIPHVLRIYSGLTDAAKTCYLGYVPMRKTVSGTTRTESSLVLKGMMDDDIFIWGTGEIFERDELTALTRNGPTIIHPSKGICEKIKILCGKMKGNRNGLLIPLDRQGTGGLHSDAHGLVLLISRDHPFTNLELQLANKVTSYFAAHLKNFEVLRKDPLTKFYNQRQKVDLITRELMKAILNNYSLGLILMDIDDFKSFNDKYGHNEGDNLLSQFGRLILRNIRPHDRPLRLGGDEFLIIAPKLGYEGLRSFAERIRTLVEAEHFHDRFGHPAHKGLTVSMGVLFLDSFEEHIADTSYYLDVVDRSLYEAKKGGKNRVVSSAYH